MPKNKICKKIIIIIVLMIDILSLAFVIHMARNNKVLLNVDGNYLCPKNYYWYLTKKAGAKDAKDPKYFYTDAWVRIGNRYFYFNKEGKFVEDKIFNINLKDRVDAIKDTEAFKRGLE